jgi:hypothetical protein
VLGNVLSNKREESCMVDPNPPILVSQPIIAEPAGEAPEGAPILVAQGDDGCWYAWHPRGNYAHRDRIECWDFAVLIEQLWPGYPVRVLRPGERA